MIIKIKIPLKRSLKHLPLHKQKELNEIVAYVKENTSVDMVILFGSYARGNWVEDKYVENGTTYEYKSDYDLLFVVKDEAKANRPQQAKRLKRRILKHAEVETPLNVIYHGIDYLNAEIENGNYFFTDILKEGIRLHHNKKFVLAKPKQLTVKDRLKKAELYFGKWFEGANVFYEDFSSNLNKHNKGQVYLNQAAFLLHQATERYFMCVLLVFTDYKPKIHDLEELHTRACRQDARFKTVFTQQTDEEERMFTLLKKAYIDSRYKIGYEIKKEELEYLSKQVRLLKTLTERICKEKIEQLK